MKENVTANTKMSNSFLGEVDEKEGLGGTTMAPPAFAVSASPIQPKEDAGGEKTNQVGGRRAGKGVNDHLAVSEKALQFIIQFEGSKIENGRHVLYDDPANLATIGYGHLVAEKKVAELTEDERAPWANGLTEAEALTLMRKDCKSFEMAIRSKVTVELQQHEFDALVTWLFNVGAAWAGLGDHEQASLIKNINAGEFDKVGNNMGQFQKADGAFSQGILNRRNSEINIFNYGYGDESDPYRSKGEFKAPMGADHWKEDYWGKHLASHQNISKLGVAPTGASTTEKPKEKGATPASIWVQCGEDASRTADFLSPLLGKDDRIIAGMLDYLYWKQDNFAYFLVKSKSAQELKSVNPSLLVRLRGAIDAYWTDEDDYKQIGKIDFALSERAHDFEAAKQRKDQNQKDQTALDSAKRVANKGTPLKKSVGAGGVNEASEVQMVKDRLLQLEIITPREHASKDASVLIEVIKRYQRRVLGGKADGLISPAGTTANRLVQGVRGVAKLPSDELSNVLAAERFKQQEQLGGVSDIGGTVDKIYASAEGDPKKIGALMTDYLRKNPKMVDAMLDRLGSEADGMVVSLVLAADAASVAGADKALLARMYQILEAGETTYAEYAVMARLEAHVSSETNEVANTEWDFSSKELDVKKYWKSQGDTANCDVYTKKVIDGHKKDNPELYQDFGSIGAEKTIKANSLHTVWEQDHEQGTARTQGPKGKNESSTLLQDAGEWELAIRYIVACLNAGVPAMVGVNHTFAYARASGNDDKSTDHWLTIIGKGADEKGMYFIYTDPGTGSKTVGTDSDKNRLYQKEDKYIWRDDSKYANSDGGAGAGSYTLVAVTLYENHRGKSEFKVGGETFKRNGL